MVRPPGARQQQAMDICLHQRSKLPRALLPRHIFLRPHWEARLPSMLVHTAPSSLYVSCIFVHSLGCSPSSRTGLSNFTLCRTDDPLPRSLALIPLRASLPLHSFLRCLPANTHPHHRQTPRAHCRSQVASETVTQGLKTINL